MKASDFEIGATVHLVDDASSKGKVIGNTLSDGDQMVAVEWDDGELQKVDVDELKIYDQAIELAYSQIQEKVKAATALLKEANGLADQHSTSLSDLYYELGFSDLFRQLDEAGWSSSSMRC